MRSHSAALPQEEEWAATVTICVPDQAASVGKRTIEHVATKPVVDPLAPMNDREYRRGGC